MDVQRQFSGGEFGEEYKTERGGSVFAPVPHGQLAALIVSYRELRGRIKGMASTMATAHSSDELRYFRKGNRVCTGIPLSASPDQPLDVEGALSALRSDFWSRALQLTDVYESMPQARQEAWNTRLLAWLRPGYRRGVNPAEDLPEFDKEAVDNLISNLLHRRPLFLAERVHGIFVGLSGKCLANQPEAFLKPLVIDLGLDKWERVSYQKLGLINELRWVVSKFKGANEQPHFTTTYKLLNRAKSTRSAVCDVDGGVLRFTFDKAGVADLTVSGEIAWRLNAVISKLHPSAIPEKYQIRQRNPFKHISHG